MASQQRFGYEFRYWLKRAFGARALRAALARRPRAPPPPQEGANLTEAADGDIQLQLRMQLRSWSWLQAGVTCEPPTRPLRICTPATGIKGATRRGAMASGHP